MRLADVKPFDDMHEDRNGHQHVDSDCFDCVCGDPACWHAPDPSARNCRGECDRPNCDCPAAVFAEDVEQLSAVAAHSPMCGRDDNGGRCVCGAAS